MGKASLVLMLSETDGRLEFITTMKLIVHKTLVLLCILVDLPGGPVGQTPQSDYRMLRGLGEWGLTDQLTRS